MEKVEIQCKAKTGLSVAIPTFLAHSRERNRAQQHNTQNTLSLPLLSFPPSKQKHKETEWGRAADQLAMVANIKWRKYNWKFKNSRSQLNSLVRPPALSSLSSPSSPPSFLCVWLSTSLFLSLPFSFSIFFFGVRTFQSDIFDLSLCLVWAVSALLFQKVSVNPKRGINPIKLKRGGTKNKPKPISTEGEPHRTTKPITSFAFSLRSQPNPSHPLPNSSLFPIFLLCPLNGVFCSGSLLGFKRLSFWVVNLLLCWESVRKRDIHGWQ